MASDPRRSLDTAKRDTSAIVFAGSPSSKPGVQSCWVGRLRRVPVSGRIRRTVPTTRPL